ncbi:MULTISPECIES: serine hydrolase [Listeria]|uniref:serine hydrolase domain-containing protein n=1 Tax=Listeria TaxID=1637 RepID=UPI000B590993|nr:MULTISPECIES: serine hydrolase domain-containing protein [Listeria]
MFPLTKMRIENLVDSGTVPGASFQFLTQEATQSFTRGLKQISPSKKPLLSFEKNIYDIASLTKVVATTTRVMQLVESGKLALTDSLGTFLPDYHTPDLTLLDCLTHRTGLPKNIPGFPIETPSDIDAYISAARPVAKNRTIVDYSDLNFLLLGKVIEVACEKPFEAQVTDAILRPLHMEDTTFFTADKAHSVPTEVTEKRGVISGTVHDHKAFIAGGNTGHAGLFSTLDDLRRFASALLFDDGAPILTRESLARIQENYTQDLNRDRGIGYDLKPNGDHYALYHTGFTGTFIVLDIVQKKGLIVLTNRIHPSRNNSAFLEEREQIVTTFLNEKAE